VEVVAAGVLALAAPAAYWTGSGASLRVGWVLWLLTWLQAAGSIVFVHLRLEQRRWEHAPGRGQRLRQGARALAYAGFSLLACLVLSAFEWAPGLAPLAFAAALADTAQGVIRPAVGLAARAIGLRQLASSVLFTLLLAFAYLG
jgi:hypothetical protein